MPDSNDTQPPEGAEDAAAEKLLASWMDDDGEPQEGEPEEKFDADRYKAKISKANREAENLRKRLKEYEDRDKSDTEKLTEDRDTHKSRADKAEAELARYRVAAAKGLTPGQAKRLVGTTEEELSADADELLADLGGKPASGKPAERLRGGSVSVDEPAEDIAKIVADIPRT